MSFLFGGSGGFTFLRSATTSEVEEYAPVRAPVPDITPYYEVIGDLYRRIEGREVLERVWKAALAHLAGELLLHWQYAAARRLSTIPVLIQRKWVQFFLRHVVDLTQDPAWLQVGDARFVYSASLARIQAIWRNRLGFDGYATALRGTATEAARLKWTFEVEFSDLSAPPSGKRSYALVGYQGAAGGLYVGLGSDNQLAVIHREDSGQCTLATSVPNLISQDIKYRVEAAYAGTTTKALVATVYELDKVLVDKTTAGQGVQAVDDSDTDPFTTTVQDTTVSDFAAEGVVADRSVFQAYSDSGTLLFESVISQVSGDTLQLSEARLLPSTALLRYKVVDEEEVGSVALDVAATATDERFSVTQFGVFSLDVQGTFPQGTSWAALGQKVVGNPIKGFITALSYVDPTVDASIRDIPYLQPAPLDSTGLLTHPNDFVLASGQLEFAQDHPDVLFAEYVRADERTVQMNFGDLVGLSGDSSAAYLASVQALFGTFFRGATPTNLRRGVHIYMGLPIALEAGEVTAVNPLYSGERGQITIQGETTQTYLYPLSVGTTLVVGAQVEKFEPLCNGVDHNDYIGDPLWWLPYGSAFNELQKYNAFEIVIDADVLDLDQLPAAVEFLNAEKLRPTWKRTYLRVMKSVADTFVMSDRLYIFGTVVIKEPWFPAPVPMWDSQIAWPGVSFETDGYEPLWRGVHELEWDQLQLDATPGHFSWERGRAASSGLWTGVDWSLASATQGRIEHPVLHSRSYSVPETVKVLVFDSVLNTYTQWEDDGLGTLTCTSHSKYADAVTYYGTIDYNSGVIDFTLGAHDLTDVWVSYATQYVHAPGSSNVVPVPFVDWWFDQTPDPSANPPPASRAYIDQATTPANLDNVDTAHPTGWTWPMASTDDVPVTAPLYSPLAMEDAQDHVGQATSADGSDPGQPGSSELLISGSPAAESTGDPPDAFWDGYAEQFAWDELVWVQAENVSGSPANINWFGVSTPVAAGGTLTATETEAVGTYP